MRGKSHLPARGTRKQAGRGWLTAGLVLLCAGLPLAWGAPQTGDVPLPLHPTAPSVLMADRAARTDSLTIRSLGAPKRSWGSNWTLASQEWSWSVSAPAEGSYECTVLVSGPLGTVLHLSSDLGASYVTLAEQGWQRATFAVPLYLPAGASTIALRLEADAASILDLLSVEVVPASVAGAHRDRALASRSKDDWFQRANYGVGVVWGEWCYPPTGEKKPWPEQVDDFDVDAFVAAVADTGADYLLLSTSWATYFVAAPIAAVDAVLPGRTSQRDLIGEIANGLHDRGIRLILYYHAGHGDAAWWAVQEFDEDDKEAFVERWESIITEIGQRYGDRLDGWWFDDGIVYYPAPFERMSAAARSGNPNRLVTYNNWAFPRFTEFQDLAAGENFNSMRHDDSTLIPLDERDLYVGGECEGMIPHGYFVYEQGHLWAVDRPDWDIGLPVWSAATTEATIRTYAPRTFTLNLLAYEDGSFGEATRSSLASVRRAFEAPSIGCRVANWLLRSAGDGASDVGLAVTASDAQDPPDELTCTITVGANEAPPGEGVVFSPPSSLILSAESPPSGGRSYLVGLRGMDTDGNPGRGACSVLVPARLAPSHLTRLLWEAVEAEAAFVRESAMPANRGATVLPEEACR